MPFLNQQLIIDGNVIMQCMNVNRAFKEMINFKWLRLNEAVRVSLNSVWLERTFRPSDIRSVHTQKNNYERAHWEGGHLHVSKGGLKGYQTCLHIDLRLLASRTLKNVLLYATLLWQPQERNTLALASQGSKNYKNVKNLLYLHFATCPRHWIETCIGNQWRGKGGISNFV